MVEFVLDVLQVQCYFSVELLFLRRQLPPKNVFWLFYRLLHQGSIREHAFVFIFDVGVQGWVAEVGFAASALVVPYVFVSSGPSVPYFESHYFFIVFHHFSYVTLNCSELFLAK